MEFFTYTSGKVYMEPMSNVPVMEAGDLPDLDFSPIKSPVRVPPARKLSSMSLFTTPTVKKANKKAKQKDKPLVPSFSSSLISSSKSPSGNSELQFLPNNYKENISLLGGNTSSKKSDANISEELIQANSEVLRLQREK